MKRWALIWALLWLAGCGPQATPFPVNFAAEEQRIPGTTQPSVDTGIADGTPGASGTPIRYALAPNLQNVPLDYALLGTALQIIQLEDEAELAQVGSGYEIVVGYGDLPNGQRSPLSHHVALVINPAVPPFADSALVVIVRNVLNVSQLSAALNITGAEFGALTGSAPGMLRVELANAGRPDGVRAVLGIMGLPGDTLVYEQLRAAGVVPRVLLLEALEIASAWEANLLNMALIQWKLPEERDAWVAQVGEANVLDLYTLPISYVAVPDLAVTFNRDGWPVPSRPG